MMNSKNRKNNNSSKSLRCCCSFSVSLQRRAAAAAASVVVIVVTVAVGSTPCMMDHFCLSSSSLIKLTLKHAFTVHTHTINCSHQPLIKQLVDKLSRKVVLSINLQSFLLPSVFLLQ